LIVIIIFVHLRSLIIIFILLNLDNKYFDIIFVLCNFYDIIILKKYYILYGLKSSLT